MQPPTITSCSSGTVGVGYEGDTCRITCNTDYELTDSDARTDVMLHSFGTYTTLIRSCALIAIRFIPQILSVNSFLIDFNVHDKTQFYIAIHNYKISA